MREVLEAKSREGLDLGLLLGLDHQLQLAAPRLVLLDEVLLPSFSREKTVVSLSVRTRLGVKVYRT